MYFDYTDSTNIHNNIVFMHKPIEFIFKVQLFGMNISTDIYDRHVPGTVRHFYCLTNEVLLDFRSISCDIKCKLMSTYC